MKKTVFFVIFSILFMVSCDKLFVGVSGKEVDLQGKWQMDNADSVYYNFQNSIFQYQIYITENNLSDVFGYYTLFEDNVLELRLLREYASIQLDHLGWDTLYSVTGQDTIFKKFTINKFTKKQLILQSDKEKISFHKF